MRLIDADRLLEERRLHLYYHLPNGDTAIPIIDIKHAPTINDGGWISVSKRLPKEKDGRVLICMPDKSPHNQNQPFPGCEVSQRVTTGKYSEFSKMWYIGDMCGVGGDNPIAWMPLPDPPKDNDINNDEPECLF